MSYSRKKPGLTTGAESRETLKIPINVLARLRRKMVEPGLTCRPEFFLQGKKVTFVLDDNELPKREPALRGILEEEGASPGSLVTTYSIFINCTGRLFSDIFILCNSSLFSKNERRYWICEALAESRKANPDSAYVVYTQCPVIYQDLLDLVGKGVVNAVEDVGERNDLQLAKHASGVHDRVQL